MSAGPISMFTWLCCFSLWGCVMCSTDSCAPVVPVMPLQLSSQQPVMCLQAEAFTMIILASAEPFHACIVADEEAPGAVQQPCSGHEQLAGPVLLGQGTL